MLFAFSYAQKYAYVDTDYILENIPEYTDAQNQLDDISIEYQTEIEDKFAEIDKLYKNYQAEAVLLPEDMKKKKEEEIINKEKEAKDLQRKRFGKDGDLFIKRQELVKPIQEKVYNAIEEIATDKNYSFVFDKSGSLTILYVNPKYDISDDVLDKVGAVMGTVRKEDRTKKNEGKNPARPGGFGEGSVIKREK
ncbi:MAG: OmpH family outer membrane protein [Bacteroidales bacterium]|nr:OmpH family outer membrane protein [Bacteroidales bacterium]